VASVLVVVVLVVAVVAVGGVGVGAAVFALDENLLNIELSGSTCFPGAFGDTLIQLVRITTRGELGARGRCVIAVDAVEMAEGGINALGVVVVTGSFTAGFICTFSIEGSWGVVELVLGLAVAVVVVVVVVRVESTSPLRWALGVPGLELVPKL